MTNAIEYAAKKALVHFLKSKEIKILPSNCKTFDYVIKGKFAEVKGKKNLYEKIDFISFTQKQYRALGIKSFNIYLICNALKKGKEQIFLLNSRKLDLKKSRKVISYEFGRSLLKSAHLIKLK